MFAFTHAGTVIAGWGATVGTFALYAAWMHRRARALSRVVPPEERRWT